MTSPPETINVVCPAEGCGFEYKDWHRASLNLAMDDFDEEYVREASTAKCPSCGHVVELSVLVVAEDGIWRMG